ncbi:MAG: Hpt domain-containing protein [Desulfobulbaceae bacterium]|nr:Hpt domain-containing protein [Desulfobulbaceae bacterium]HIJ78747.1 Hpt domain-containing protein [Deltaproteobacteria bacterium]
MERLIVKVDQDLLDLIPGFLKNKKNDINKIKTALPLGDYETVRVTGHNMKGSGAGYGFLEISEIGAGIETAAGKQDHEQIIYLLNQLTDYLDRVSFEPE